MGTDPCYAMLIFYEFDLQFEKLHVKKLACVGQIVALLRMI